MLNRNTDFFKKKNLIDPNIWTVVYAGCLLTFFSFISPSENLVLWRIQHIGTVYVVYKINLNNERGFA